MIKEIDIKDFNSFVKNSNQYTFHQTEEWLELKNKNGWSGEFIGYYENSNLKGCALLLKKKLFLNKYFYYSPRGFIIDYNNFELLKNFTEELRKYLKKKNGIFVKIDPYVEYQERDINGTIVENGYNNFNSHKNLISLKYKHYGFTTTCAKELQPRWIYTLNLKDKTEDELMSNMNKSTRKNVRKTMKLGLELKEIGVEGLEDFKKIMQNTSNRRGFVDRPMSYYKEMFDIFKEKMTIILCYLNTDVSLKLLKDEMNHINDDEKIQLQKRIDDIANIKEEYGNIVCLTGSMFIDSGKELISLFGGNDDTFMRFDGMYSTQWHAIKFAKEKGYDKFNFYGIEGNFQKENNPMYGVYEFKRGFGGKVEELLGEYDLVISPFFYSLYKILFAIYRGTKRLIHKIKNPR